MQQRKSLLRSALSLSGFVPDELVPGIYARVADSIELMVIVTYANGYISAAISQEESFDDYPPSKSGW